MGGIECGVCSSCSASGSLVQAPALPVVFHNYLETLRVVQAGGSSLCVPTLRGGLSMRVFSLIPLSIQRGFISDVIIFWRKVFMRYSFS